MFAFLAICGDSPLDSFTVSLGDKETESRCARPRVEQTLAQGRSPVRRSAGAAAQQLGGRSGASTKPTCDTSAHSLTQRASPSRKGMHDSCIGAAGDGQINANGKLLIDFLAIVSDDD